MTLLFLSSFTISIRKFLFGPAFLRPRFAVALPGIAKQPTQRVGAIGGNATFTVAARGTGLTYQCQKNGVDLSNVAGATRDVGGNTNDHQSARIGADAAVVLRKVSADGR